MSVPSCPASMARRAAVWGAAVVLVAVAVGGCAGYRASASGSPGVDPKQECAQAVLDVLTGLITTPYDGRPFADFVNRYGTQSFAYNAYRDSFARFIQVGRHSGVPAAKDAVRPIVLRDCTGGQ